MRLIKRTILTEEEIKRREEICKTCKFFKIIEGKECCQVVEFISLIEPWKEIYFECIEWKRR